MSYQTPINRPSKRQFVLGIDPDKNQSGFAVWSYPQNKFVKHVPLYFAELQETCLGYDPYDCVVYLEAGWLNEGRNKYQSKTLPKDFDTWSRARREAYIFERGCDVGINFGAGFAITHVLRANGYTVNHYCPKTAKWDPAALRRYTGITALTNQDTRDAIRAAYLNR
jgi:hypothetical protein